MVTDGEEEAVDREIYTLFVGLTQALDEMYAFDAIFSVEAKGIVLVEDGDLLIRCYTLTHDIRSTQVILAHDHVDM